MRNIYTSLPLCRGPVAMRHHVRIGRQGNGGVRARQERGNCISARATHRPTEEVFVDGRGRGRRQTFERTGEEAYLAKEKTDAAF